MISGRSPGKYGGGRRPRGEEITLGSDRRFIFYTFLLKSDQCWLNGGEQLLTRLSCDALVVSRTIVTRPWLWWSVVSTSHSQLERVEGGRGNRNTRTSTLVYINSGDNKSQQRSNYDYTITQINQTKGRGGG